MVKFHVWHAGKSTEGVPGDRSTLVIDVDVHPPATRAAYVERIKLMLMTGFEWLWNVPVTVTVSDGTTDFLPTAY